MNTCTFAQETFAPMIQMPNGRVWHMDSLGWIHGDVRVPPEFSIMNPDDRLEAISGCATGSPSLLTDIDYRDNGKWCSFSGYFSPFADDDSDDDEKVLAAIGEILAGHNASYPRLSGEKLFRAILGQYPILTTQMALSAMGWLEHCAPRASISEHDMIEMRDTPFSLLIMADSGSGNGESFPYLGGITDPGERMIALMHAVRRSSPEAKRINDAGLYVSGIQVLAF